MLNLKLLRDKYESLIQHCVTVEDLRKLDDFPIIFKLAVEKKEVTPQTMLAKKMECVLEDMNDSDPLKPFLQAIKEMYEERSCCGNCTKIERE